MRCYILIPAQWIIIGEDKKIDLKKLFGWNEKEFRKNTLELIKPNKKLQKAIKEGITL